MCSVLPTFFDFVPLFPFLSSENLLQSSKQVQTTISLKPLTNFPTFQLDCGPIDGRDPDLGYSVGGSTEYTYIGWLVSNFANCHVNKS